MILVDTGIWVDHLRRGDDALRAALQSGEVVCHEFVIGELACGHLSARRQILALIAALPLAPRAEHEEVIALVERHRLMGTGIGWVDAQLLASASLGRHALWSRDTRLRGAANAVGVAHDAR